MININATLIIQLINFLLLLLIMNHLLYKPILKMLDKRKAMIDHSKERSKELYERAGVKTSEYGVGLAEAKQAANSQREKIKFEGSQQAKEIIEAARKEEAKIIESIKQEIKKESDKAWPKVKSQSDKIAKNITEKILGRKV